MKKFPSVVCFLLLTTLAWLGSPIPQAQAGGTVQTVDGTTVITVMVPFLPNPSDPSTVSRAWLAVIHQFEKDYVEIFKAKYKAKYEADPAKYGKFDWDHVAVRLIQFSGLQIEGVESDLMAIAGGSPPDVLQVNFRKSDTYISNGFLYPMDKPEDGYLTALTPEDIAARIHPKLKPVIDRKGPDGQMHVWALPWGGFLGKVLAYRKELFDEAGLSYPDANWTWDDMLAAAKKLTDPTRGRAGIIFAVPEPGYNFTTFLWSAGGQVMTFDEKADAWTCAFGTSNAAEALDFYNTLTMEPWKTKEGKVTRGYANTDTALGGIKWERGDIGMQFMYIDQHFFLGLDPDKVGIAPVPKGPHGERAAEINSAMLGLFAEIKSPVVRDAAWEYIVYQQSEAALRVNTKIMVEGGYGRFLNPELLEKFGYPEIVRLTPKGWADAFKIAIDTGMPEPYGHNSNLAYRMLARPIDEVAQMSLANKLPEDHAARLKVIEEVLKRGETKANEVMIGTITPEARHTRNIAAAIFLTAMVIAFGYVFFKILRVFSDNPTATVSSSRNNWKRTSFVYLLLMPALLTILVWKYYPLVMGSVMGFQDYRILGTSSWVGLKHFGDLLWDNLWWNSVWNSIRFSFLMLVFGFFPPFILAILLQEVPRGKILYRLLFYLPAVLSGLVTVLLWKQFYDPTPNGALNNLIARVPALGFFLVGAAVLWAACLMGSRFFMHRQYVSGAVVFLIGAVFTVSICSIAWPIVTDVGLTFGNFFSRLGTTLPEPVQWLKDPRYAMIACIIPGIWGGMGPGCLIYLAALKGIPEDYYEAADIDGATFLDKIMAIVIPTLRPLIMINFVGAFIGSWLGSSDTILAMTGGTAGTEVAPLSIFYKAFVYLEYGPATAMAWLLGFLLIGFTVYQLRLLAKVEFKTTGGN